MSTEPLVRAPIAHRGLHDLSRGVPENSLAAVSAAVDATFAVELDVRVSADGVAMVHHDATLRRLCGRPGWIRQSDSGWLTGQRLAGTGERIPTLAQALDIVAGRVPVLLDVKCGWRPATRRSLVAAVAAAIRGRDGEYAVMSFDALLVRAVGDAVPGVLRGQSAGLPLGARPARVVAGVARPLDHGWAMAISGADFVAMNVDRAAEGVLARWHARGLPVLAWTVRSTEQLRQVAAKVDNVIVEDCAARYLQAERISRTLPRPRTNQAAVLGAA